MTAELVARYIKLFRGRADCYGSWGGGCVRQRLTRGHFERHLCSNDSEDWIGVYPIIGEMASWGCVDIDGKDFDFDWEAMFSLARTYQRAMGLKNIPIHIERSANGFHAWVFPERPLTPAWVVRRAQIAGCHAIGYKPKEVFPKQESDKGGVGNYVRLPYPGALAHDEPLNERYFLTSVGEDNRSELEAALTMLEEGKAGYHELEAVAKLWTPPAPPRIDIDPEAGSAEARELLHKMNSEEARKLAWTIYKEGPYAEGGDRSTALAKLAHLCREGGLKPSETYVVIEAADERMGKFVGRADRDVRLTELVENAYAHRAAFVRIRERRQAPVSGALTEDDFALIADD